MEKQQNVINGDVKRETLSDESYVQMTQDRTPETKTIGMSVRTKVIQDACDAIVKDVK